MFGFTKGKSMDFDKTALFPLVLKLGEYLKKAYDHYLQLKIAGSDIDVETLTMFVQIQIATWNPQYKGKAVLDDATRKAAARFIAGVAKNMFKEEKKDV
jgi:hypothetical protein